MLQVPPTASNVLHSSSPCALPPRLQASLDMLLEAVEFAKQTSGDRWEFAVEIECLQALDLRPNDFRWLVRKGWVEHRQEVTPQDVDGRMFRPTGDLSFPARTCFVLTDAGTAVAAKLPSKTPSPSTLEPLHERPHERPNERPNERPAPVPDWDTEKRELRYQGVVVKRFKWQAANQETVLMAFHEEGWPARIDDPLPPKPDQDSRRRLSDTIKCLNRKQAHSVLRFRGDGTGEGVIWEVADRHTPVEED